ncbi:hypothetical protein LWI28_005589 [Acer negundo]|uniref:Uncharacterized protein n=1 Tax=Acer negundo TaxID=4023 RepID=A0AAD5NI74_ACENE|nr:hypothetical protein LWI28_005589 [Acer negundo]
MWTSSGHRAYLCFQIFLSSQTTEQKLCSLSVYQAPPAHHGYLRGFRSLRLTREQNWDVISRRKTGRFYNSMSCSFTCLSTSLVIQHDRMSRNRRRMEEEEEDSMIEEDNFTMKCPEDAEFQKPKIISLWVCSEILWLECVQFLIFYGAMNIITAKLTSFPLQSFHVMIIDR